MFDRAFRVFALILSIIALIVSIVALPASGAPTEQSIGYTGDLSSLITDACIVDGLPRILSFNNYGDTVNKKTVMYQRSNGDIAVIYIDQYPLSTAFYVWATDKVANGTCPQ